MSLEYYEEILTDVLNGELDDYDGYKRLDSLPLVDVVDIVCHRMRDNGMTHKIQMKGSIIPDIVDILARNESYSWHEALQAYYDWDLTADGFYERQRLPKGIY